MSATAEIAWKSKERNPGFSSLFEHAPFAMAQCNGSGVITASNRAFEKLVAIAGPSQPLSFPDLIRPLDGKEAERLFAELFNGSENIIQIDCEASGSDGAGLRWTLWRVLDSQCAGSAIAFAEVMSARAATDESGRHAARLEIVGRVAGGVAHDFNNLLTGILLYCDLLLASIDSSHRAYKYADEIRKAGAQASGLVRQLLAVLRPANAQPRPLSLNEIVEGMRSLLARLIGENIELNVRLDPALGLVQMDPAQAQQILLNLALNARDAMPGGGRITIETRNCKVQVLPPSECGDASLQCALFVVQDNGNGMDAFTRAHLFDPFFTTKAEKGTGLGLATVHDIVIASGGLIYVSSEPGRGTRISLLLPLLPDMAVRDSSSNDFHPADDGKVSSYPNQSKGLKTP